MSKEIKEKIENLRVDYKRSKLSSSDCHKLPLDQFKKWFDEACNSKIREANAMALSTCSKDHKPSTRMVLCKEITDTGLVFYTNYESNKARDMEANPNVALLFFWSGLERQVRMEGVVSRVSKKKSEEYFQSRPIDAQISAIISKQSRELQSRKTLEAELKKAPLESRLSCPDYWGGYIVEPSYYEFWQGRSGRLHDRITYTQKEKNVWQIKRLYP